MKILEGNPGRRPLNLNEPHPPPGDPTPPDFLDENGRKEWERIVPQLVKLGLFSVLDYQQVAVMCQTAADYWAAERKVHELGEVVTAPNGQLQLNPYVRIAKDLRLALIRYAAELGCTVSSRGRISVPQPKKNDTFREFLDEGA